MERNTKKPIKTEEKNFRPIKVNFLSMYEKWEKIVQSQGHDHVVYCLRRQDHICYLHPSGIITFSYNTSLTGPQFCWMLLIFFLLFYRTGINYVLSKMPLTGHSERGFGFNEMPASRNPSFVGGSAEQAPTRSQPTHSLAKDHVFHVNLLTIPSTRNNLSLSFSSSSQHSQNHIGCFWPLSDYSI